MKAEISIIDLEFNSDDLNEMIESLGAAEIREDLIEEAVDYHGAEYFIDESKTRNLMDYHSIEEATSGELEQIRDIVKGVSMDSKVIDILNAIVRIAKIVAE